MKLRRALWRRGWRYRLHMKSLVGKPDIVFLRTRLAVFVDSDWWHGKVLRERPPDEWSQYIRGARQNWWIQKLKRNVERDRTVTAELERQGWTVLRFWESDIRTDVEAVADIVEDHLRRVASSTP